MIVQVPGEEREKNLSLLSNSDPADISPDGKTVLFTDSGGDGVDRIYLRRTDGSPAVRLGDGRALALSADGRWALGSSEGMMLLPTGAGKARPIAVSGVVFGSGTFSPDGKRLVLGGQAKNGAFRVYAVDVEAGEPHPVTPEGIDTFWHVHTVSPDGKLVVAKNHGDGAWSIWPIEPGALPARPVPEILAVELPIRWSPDGRSLFVWTPTSGSLSRLDLASGRRDLLKQIPGAQSPCVTPDGRGFVYAIGSSISNLYLIDGLKP